MKCFSILTLVLVITLVISACGTEAPPTVSAADMQSTAAAVARTMVAETQAAIPTATPIPPTETPTNTPAPTDTVVPLPSSEVTFAPVPNANFGGGDDCIHKALPGSLEGRKVKIRVTNSTKVAVTLSVYLNQTTPENVCGYRIYTLEAGGSIVITDLVEGCFTLWAWNPDPKGYFMVTNGASTCIMDTDTPVFDISTREIRER